MIKFNTWYLINKEDKQKFLDEVISMTSPHCINIDDEIYNAECLYLSADPFKLKYRTTYRPDYMPDIKIYELKTKDTKIIYELKTKGEPKLMENCKICNNEKLQSVVSQFYQNKADEICDICREKIRAIKGDSAIGQAAIKLEKAVQDAGKQYAILDCLPEDIFDKLTITTIKDEEKEAQEELKKLKETERIALALITSCDTYQEKLDVLKKFKIFSLE